MEKGKKQDHQEKDSITAQPPVLYPAVLWLKEQSLNSSTVVHLGKASPQASYCMEPWEGSENPQCCLPLQAHTFLQAHTCQKPTLLNTNNSGRHALTFSITVKRENCLRPEHRSPIRHLLPSDVPEWTVVGFKWHFSPFVYMEFPLRMGNHCMWLCGCCWYCHLPENRSHLLFKNHTAS